MAKYVAFGLIFLIFSWILGIFISLLGGCVGQLVVYLVWGEYSTDALLSTTFWLSFLLPIILASYYTGKGLAKICK